MFMTFLRSYKLLEIERIELGATLNWARHGVTPRVSCILLQTSAPYAHLCDNVRQEVSAWRGRTFASGLVLHGGS
jgi:hypothetical protein